MFVIKSKYEKIKKQNQELRDENWRINQSFSGACSQVIRMQERENAAKEEVEKYKALYLDELQKRLALAEKVRAIENNNDDDTIEPKEKEDA